MKSGLEGRNNGEQRPQREARDPVSMKSGLEGRNNLAQGVWRLGPVACLNEVRPGRPEQCDRGGGSQTRSRGSQ